MRSGAAHSARELPGEVRCYTLRSGEDDGEDEERKEEEEKKKKKAEEGSSHKI